MSAQLPSLQDNHRLQVVVAALFLTLFLATIDQTIVGTVAPTLATDTRYIDLWTITFVPMIGVFQILYSHLHSIFSIKIVYLLAIHLFELGSVIYTTAPNSITMMFGRAIAGAGAAGICTGGFELIGKIIPLDYFLSCIGIMLAILSFAPAVGIFIGSAFTDRSIWQWSVYVNLPLGSLIMYYLVRYYVHISMDAHPPVSSRPDEVFCLTDPLYRTPGILPGPWGAISYL